MGVGRSYRKSGPRGDPSGGFRRQVLRRSFQGLPRAAQLFAEQFDSAVLWRIHSDPLRFSLSLLHSGCRRELPAEMATAAAWARFLQRFRSRSMRRRRGPAVFPRVHDEPRSANREAYRRRAFPAHRRIENRRAVSRAASPMARSSAGPERRLAREPGDILTLKGAEETVPPVDDRFPHPWRVHRDHGDARRHRLREDHPLRLVTGGGTRTRPSHDTRRHSPHGGRRRCNPVGHSATPKTLPYLSCETPLPSTRNRRKSSSKERDDGMDQENRGFLRGRAGPVPDDEGVGGYPKEGGTLT